MLTALLFDKNDHSGATTFFVIEKFHILSIDRHPSSIIGIEFISINF